MVRGKQVLTLSRCLEQEHAPWERVSVAAWPGSASVDLNPSQ